MSSQYYKHKIKAFLHDPPEKALMLFEKIEGGHVGRSLQYIKTILGEQLSDIPADIKSADHVASACDRINLPGDYKEYGVDFLEQPELRHPLSGKQIELEPMKILELERVFETVEKAIEKIAADYTEEPDALKKISLSLWREFPDLLKQHESGNEKVGELWDLLPADTRIPDHSIWDHRSVVAAMAGAGLHHDNASLFLFTLGPVQDFIAASRKTVDLWSGSYLLAWLSWKAIEKVCDRYGPEAILFPNLYKQPLADIWLAANQGLKNINFDTDFTLKIEIPSLPNRFMAIIPDDELAQTAEEVQHAVNDEFKQIAKHVWDKKIFKTEPDRDQWYAQIENFIECYWTALPLKYIKTSSREEEKKEFENRFKQAYGAWLVWDNSSQNKILEAYQKNGYGINTGTVYGRLYNLIEHANGARKILRNFEQISEPGYRCTLIPLQGALAPETEIYPADFNTYWQQTAEDNKAGLINKTERLSAISLMKRCFPEYLNAQIKEMAKQVPDDVSQKWFINDRYPSTHSIAGADYKLKIIKELASGNKELEGVLNQYISAVNEFIKFVENKLKISIPDDRPLYKIKITAGNCDLDTLITAGNFCSINGEFLFEEGFFIDNEKEAFENGKESLKSEYQEIQKNGIIALKKLYEKTRRLGKPSKYYAILHFDGDHMGKWLSGEKAPFYKEVLHSDILQKLERNRPEGWDSILDSNPNNPKEENVYRPLAPATHTAISRSLNAFTDRVRNIVEVEYLGKLVYAGGDDVLALVSIGDALKVAEKIRAAFSGHLDEDGNVDWSKSSGYDIRKKKGQQYKFQNMGDLASGSAGIAIVHYMYPLQQGMQLARNAEKYAKNDRGRDAFAITTAKRSGETATTGFKWRISLEDAGEKPLMPYLNQYLKLLENGDLSHSFVFDLEQAAIGLAGFSTNGSEFYKAHPAVLNEVKRLYKRNSENLKKRSGDQEQEKYWQELMEPLFNMIPVRNLIDLLSTLQFMIRGEAR